MNAQEKNDLLGYLEEKMREAERNGDAECERFTHKELEWIVESLQTSMEMGIT